MILSTYTSKEAHQGAQNDDAYRPPRYPHHGPLNEMMQERIQKNASMQTSAS